MKKLIKLLTLATTLGSSLTAEDIHHAAARGNLTEVSRLIDENPACVHEEDTIYCGTPLHWATFNNHTNVMKFLINNGANVNAQNIYLSTPLHWAASHEHLEAAKLLINNGAFVDAKNRHKGTPLHKAARDGHLKIVRLLLDSRADVNAKDIDNKTPLHMATLHLQLLGSGLETIELLIERGADVNARDNDNKTPIDVLSRDPRTEKYITIIQDASRRQANKRKLESEPRRNPDRVARHKAIQE